VSGWRAVWSMVGRWLVYVPDPEGGEVQLSLPGHMSAEARKLAAADELLAAIEPFASCCDQISDSESDEEWAKFRMLVKEYRRAADVVRNIRGDLS